MMYIILIFLIQCTQPINIYERLDSTNAHQITSYSNNDIESMVTYYFASHIRKDENWRQVLPDSLDWSDNLKYAVKKHIQLNIITFENLGIVKVGNKTYVNIFIEIENNGHRKGGEDQVEIDLVGPNYVITNLPI